jgi:quercetin dioxygenase-like cupin family protein
MGLRRTATILGAAALLPVGADHATAADEPTLEAPIMILGEAIEYGPGPASLPAGAELVVLEGDLAQAEPYTMRLRFPDGYRIPPHSHPVREHITVLRGQLMMGLGETFDEAAVTPLPSGSFFALPAGDPHYAWVVGDTIVQRHGVGPWGITYVDPADDPRNGTRG